MRRRLRGPNSYRVQIALGYLAVVALFVGLWAWSLYGPLSAAVTRQQQTHLAGVAQAGSLAISDSTTSTADAIRLLVANTDLRMTVVAADGTVVADTQADPATMENHALRPEIAAALDGRVGHATRDSATQNVQQMYVAVPSTLQGAPVALRVSEPLQRIREITASSRRGSLAMLAAALLIALAVGYRIAARTARPVEQLAAAAAGMAAGDLAVAVPREAGSLAPLSDALMRLRTQLRERIGTLENERSDLRTVLDGLDDAVLLLEGRNIRVANHAVRSLLTTGSGDLAGLDLASSGLPAPAIATVLTNLDTPETRIIELDPDPLHRYLRVTVAPLDSAGHPRRSLVIIADITQRARLDGMRRDFVANASHELKTPTASILLLAEAAGSASEDGDAEQAAAFVGQITDEAQRLRHLVSDLLDLSRLEDAPHAGSVTDLRQHVDLSLAAHRHAANAKALSMTADFSAVEGQHVYVAAEAADVAVALDNLLANAVTYTATGNIEVSVTADSQWASITIADTGIGIPATDLSRVFERFYRVDRARSRAGGGTGLGLSLVRHAAERSGGTVAIQSALGEGTRVTVSLPRAL